MSTTATRILGLGRQKDLLEVVRLAEAELLKTHGAPRRLIVSAPAIEVTASRHGFAGPFETFAVRMRVDGKLLESIREIPQTAPTSCSLVEVEGQHELRCGAPTSSRDDEPLHKLSALLHLPEVWHVRGENFRHERLGIDRLFHEMIRRRASDLHLYPGAPPVFRVDSDTHPAAELEPVSGEQILAFVREIAPSREYERLERDNQCSFGFHQLGQAFARVSAFIKAGVPHCTLRALPEKIPSFEELHVPRAVMQRLGETRLGLVMIAGMTGSGKTTTVASLLDWINTHRAVHILTIEDPVEFVFVNKRSIVSQRNIGSDVETFLGGVHAALRQDPDVIFVGEMRDSDTIRAAIDAAATGHLVVSTFHSSTAAQVVNRIVSFFEPIERDLVRLQLRESLKCIMCQRLLPKVGGGRIPALEFLFNDTRQIGDSIQLGDSVGIRDGMQQEASESMIFERSLHGLYKQNLITLEHALAYSTSPDVFEQMRLETYVPPHLERII